MPIAIGADGAIGAIGAIGAVGAIGKPGAIVGAQPASSSVRAGRVASPAPSIVLSSVMGLVLSERQEGGVGHEADAAVGVIGGEAGDVADARVPGRGEAGADRGRGAALVGVAAREAGRDPVERGVLAEP
ncbi:MAG: hypothetical protein KIT31_42055, partial [Deltaproteobacteria bacterium]|nr:hypothetical protein [Deltaproteobacteria bacterium]